MTCFVPAYLHIEMLVCTRMAGLSCAKDFRVSSAHVTYAAVFFFIFEPENDI